MRWLYAGAFLCAGIFWGNWGIGIILGEFRNLMEEVWAPPPRYTRTATLPRSVQRIGGGLQPEGMVKKGG